MFSQRGVSGQFGACKVHQIPLGSNAPLSNTVLFQLPISVCCAPSLYHSMLCHRWHHNDVHSFHSHGHLQMCTLRGNLARALLSIKCCNLAANPLMISTREPLQKSLICYFSESAHVTTACLAIVSVTFCR